MKMTKGIRSVHYFLKNYNLIAITIGLSFIEVSAFATKLNLLRSKKTYI